MLSLLLKVSREKVKVQGQTALLGQDLVRLNLAVFPEQKPEWSWRKSFRGRIKGTWGSMKVRKTRAGSRVGGCAGARVWLDGVESEGREGKGQEGRDGSETACVTGQESDFRLASRR